MKFVYCPGCLAELKRPQESNLLYEYCPGGCELGYSQYFNYSYEEEVSYFKFDTKRFHISVHISPTSYTPHSKLALIYSRKTLTERGFAKPILQIPAAKINILNLDGLDEKLHLLTVFS